MTLTDKEILEIERILDDLDDICSESYQLRYRRWQFS